MRVVHSVRVPVSVGPRGAASAIQLIPRSEATSLSGSVIVDGLGALVVPVHNVRPDPENARRGDIAAIRGSLTVFGQRKPIVVKRVGEDAEGRPTGIVIAGNHTYLAAVELGWSEIAAVFVDDDPMTARAYALADNRTGELASWDDEQLAATLRTLSADSFDMSSLGWTEQQLATLLSDGANAGDDDADDIDEVPEVPDPVTKLGDLWTVGPHRVLCGDATDRQDWQTIARDVTDALTFTSPPYNMGMAITHGRDVYAGGISDRLTMDGWRTMVNTAMDHAANYGPYTILNVQLLAGNKLGLLDLLHDRRENLADIAIWHKTNWAPAYERILSAAFEFLLIFGAGPHKNRAIDVATFSQGTTTNVHVGPSANGNKYHDEHSATMPMHLPRWVLQNFTRKGATVIDCFGGLGTTLIAAHEMERQARLIEIDPHFVDLALSRIQHVTGLVPERSGKPHDFNTAEV